MAKQDYYDILGVSRTASDAELKAAFRKLAMQHHPDRNPGDKDCEHRFKEIGEAYEVLKDPQKRAAYDRFGHAAFEQGGMGAGPGFGSDFATAFSDIFDDLFGMGGRRGCRRRSPARIAPVRVRRPAPSRRPVPIAAATARSATPRDSLRWSVPARFALAVAR
jgi:molecular chaperone DnaJ